MNELLLIIFQVLLIILLAIATFCGITICKKFNIEIDSQKLSIIIGIIQDIVDSVSQTDKQSMYNENAEITGDTKLTTSQKIQLFKTSFNLIDNALTQEQKDYINKNYGSYVDGIKILIEACLYNSSHANYINAIEAEPLCEIINEE